MLVKKRKKFFFYPSIWSLNHNKKSLIETDCIAIGIELCNIPQIS